MQQQEEIFVPIKDFPGYYVSNLGRVYSAKKEKNKTTSILTPMDNGHGYMKVRLYKDGKIYKPYIHRLVAEAFIPNPDNLPQVNHKNENKLDNSVDNLEWCSHKDNNRYSRCRPVMDITTGVIYLGAVDASLALNIHKTTIGACLYKYKGKYRDHQFIYLPKAAEDSTNTIELFGKKYEIPEILDADELDN